jgi:hypothetical protein
MLGARVKTKDANYIERAELYGVVTVCYGKFFYLQFFGFYWFRCWREYPFGFFFPIERRGMEAGNWFSGIARSAFPVALTIAWADGEFGQGVDDYVLFFVIGQAHLV